MTIYDFTLVSDLHGWKPALPGGDVLIISGDLVAHSREDEYAAFRDWVALQPYKKTIITAGNHDTLIQDDRQWWFFNKKDVELLIDESTIWNGIKFYATPWSLIFPNQNPAAKAFTVFNEDLALEKFQGIPDDTNVLITHMPPYDILDQEEYSERCGSIALRNVSLRLPQMKLHTFGHIHEAHGRFDTSLSTFVNASAVDARYKPRNPPYIQYQYNKE